MAPYCTFIYEIFPSKTCYILQQHNSDLSFQYTVKSAPSLKDLYELVTPDYGAEWKVMGTLLGLPKGELNIIAANYPTNAKRCCNEMLEKWLEMDPTASWEKLFATIESSALQPGMKIPATQLRIR